MLAEEEAALLHAEAGVPAFRLEHIFYDFDGQPVSWGWFICSGDHLRTPPATSPNQPRRGRALLPDAEAESMATTLVATSDVEAAMAPVL